VFVYSQTNFCIESIVKRIGQFDNHSSMALATASAIANSPDYYLFEGIFLTNLNEP
jgi:hypothetical protein